MRYSKYFVERPLGQMETTAQPLIVLQEMSHHELVSLSTVIIPSALMQVLLEFP